MMDKPMTFDEFNERVEKIVNFELQLSNYSAYYITVNQGKNVLRL